MIEKLIEALLLLAAGLTVVFTALSALAGMIWLIKAVDEKINTLRILTYSKKTEVEPDEVNDELVAVISAAAFSVMKKPIVIRKIHFLDNRSGDAWAVTGRLNIMASRPIRKRK
jgi:Na+-transporting methylmalonyl-CoA/oxaloacetate decarboxylase gamma subunit